MKDCIVSAGSGKWYPEGVDRLERSLLYHGFSGALELFSSMPNGPNQKPIPAHAPTHQKIPYALKLTALAIAAEKGYQRILWLDASIVCIRNPSEMFDWIGDQGHYLYRSGYNCAQSISDACLEKFGLTRDEVEPWPECASNVVGFDLNNPLGAQFFDRWHAASLDGSFNGSRQHDGQSQDPRFLFHRQDQSAASLVAHQLGIPIHAAGHFAQDYEPKMPESVIFYRQGLAK